MCISKLESQFWNARIVWEKCILELASSETTFDVGDASEPCLKMINKGENLVVYFDTVLQ